ncbi:hypothetical protein [Streptomyces sp. NPDC005799]|uniref:hypothetical protein n=1 Tax=Streptomyces sp. NPDC005799 TaxID=3154678 RepID=UPI003406978E
MEEAARAGLVPGVTATTRRIAMVLVGRMGFDTGHARYVLTDVMQRTGLSRTAVTDHIRLLRTAGWLAWVEHGSHANVRRGRGLPGYAATATVYAATIPPAYDAWAGNQLAGTGYRAWVIRPGRRSPAPTARAEGGGRKTGPTRTPSLRWVKKEGKAQVVGGERRSTAGTAVGQSRRRKKRRLTVTGYTITGERIERARQLARAVRPLVTWVQRATLDELSWVLLDLVARDWTQPQIVLWLNRLGQDIGAPRWRPKAPHRVIAAALHRKAAHDECTAVPGDLAHEERLPPVAPNAAFHQAATTVRHQCTGASGTDTSGNGYGEHDEFQPTAWEVAQLREAAKSDPTLVLATARIRGRAAAIATYGTMAVPILEAPAAYTGFRAAG